MTRYGKIYVRKNENEQEVIVVDIPNHFDFWFPFGTPNTEYILSYGYKIGNMEFLKDIENLDNQIVEGRLKHYYNEDLKYVSEFFIERLLTVEEYKQENYLDV